MNVLKSSSFSVTVKKARRLLKLRMIVWHFIINILEWFNDRTIKTVLGTLFHWKIIAYLLRDKDRPLPEPFRERPVFLIGLFFDWKPGSLIAFSWNPSMLGRLVAAVNNWHEIFIVEGWVKINQNTVLNSSSYFSTLPLNILHVYRPSMND